MNQPELVTFDNSAALAQAAAAQWVDLLERRAAGEKHCVALSGGRIARSFLAEAAVQVRCRNVDLKGVEFFWADERCVPPTDPESNFALAQETFLAPLTVDAASIHRLRGELAPATAAAQAAAELLQITPHRADGQPLLDLIFLGMGEDGHIASLFPQEPPESIFVNAVYRAVLGPKPPPQRLTLSYHALSAAHNVWVIASGPGKEDALRRSLHEPGSTPLARLLALRQNTRILTDIAAARSQPLS